MNRQTVTLLALEHVSRYRLTEVDALARTLRLRQYAARKLLTQLVQEQLLDKAPLYRHREYFFLTEKGAEFLATSLDGGAAVVGDPCHGPLSEPAKIRAFGFLCYCCLGNTQRRRLTRPELFATHPEAVWQGQPLNYYLDLETANLGVLCIDSGGEGRWDRIVHALRKDIFQHLHRPAFARLMEQGRFEMAVVTALRQKAERLQAALTETKFPVQVSLRVSVAADLLHLIAPPPYY